MHRHWGQQLHFSNEEGQTWGMVVAPKYPTSAKNYAEKSATLKRYGAFLMLEKMIQMVWNRAIFSINGLPQEYCFDIVFRHSLAIHKNELVFGTTTGNLYYSENGGVDWICLSSNLARVKGVVFT